ncbi:MAG: hypothetical protein ACRCR2_03740 [Fusobacteriaceae bacterium]
MRILWQAKRYNKLPSEIIGINNTYVAFCFDEACLHIEKAYNEEAIEFPEWRKTPSGGRKTFQSEKLK